MDQETLKSMLELFGQLGDTGARAFFWFLAVDFAKHLLDCVGIIFVFYIVVRQFTRAWVKFKEAK